MLRTIEYIFNQMQSEIFLAIYQKNRNDKVYNFPDSWMVKLTANLLEEHFDNFLLTSFGAHVRRKIEYEILGVENFSKKSIFVVCLTCLFLLHLYQRKQIKN